MEKLGFTVCSDGQSKNSRTDIEKLKQMLEDMGQKVICSPYVYCGEDGVRSETAQKRAEALMNLYVDEEVKAIFDISGGDIANEVLPFLDYEIIAKNNKIFYGYSDLTTIVNAIYTKTGKISGLWQIKNLLWDGTGMQGKRFVDFFKKCRWQPGVSDFDNLDYQFLRGREMEGIMVGGNIRCFLKLAGTPYFPDLTGKILLLEARGGIMNQLITYLAQLRQLGAFDKIHGILLGTFTRMEELGMREQLEQEVLEVTGNLPVAVTGDIGHGRDAKCAWIGKQYHF